MGWFDQIKEMLSSKGINLPENLDTPQELTDRAKDLASTGVDALSQVTDKIPGDKDDQLVDSIKQKLQ